MSTQVLIDPSCDLPQRLLKQFNAGVLPVKLNLCGESLLDYRDPGKTAEFYAKKYLSGRMVDTQPADDQVLQDVLVNSYEHNDNVLVITPCRKRSETFFKIQPIAQKLNNQTEDHSKIKVLDSRSLFCGQSVLAATALALTRKTRDFNKIRRQLDDLTNYLYSYMVPTDLLHVRERAHKRGDNSVSWISAALATTINICPIVLFRNEHAETIDKVKGFNNAIDHVIHAVAQQIQKNNLKTPFVAIAYAGDIDKIQARDAYKSMQQMAKAHKVEVIVSKMSLTSAVHMGLGGVSISIACKTSPIDAKDAS